MSPALGRMQRWSSASQVEASPSKVLPVDAAKGMQGGEAVGVHPGEATALHLLHAASSMQGQVAGLRAIQDIHGSLPSDSQEE